MKQTQPKPRFPPVLALTFGVFAISFGSILVRLAQNENVPSLVIAAWRTGLASLFLLPLALSRKRAELAQLTRTDWGWALLSGGMLGLHFGSWVSSLLYTTITSSTVLVTTSPLWVAMASPFFLKEPLSRPLKIGTAMALAGSVVVGLGDVLAVQDGRLAFNLAQPSAANPMLGNGLALIGAAAAAAYLLIGRRLRPKLSLLSYTAVVYSMAALTLLVAALSAGEPLFAYSPRAYLLFLLMAIFPQLIGHSSFNWALGYLPAAYVSVAVISEPVGATILGVLLFREIPGPVAVAGSLFILAGVVKASQREAEILGETTGDAA